MGIDKAVDSTVLDGYFTDIANAIRGKNGESGTYTPSQMAQKITDIPSGGGGDNLPARADGSLTSFSDSTITSVINYAFYYCNNLESVSLSSVTTIGEYAFSNCPKLGSINLPSVTVISDYAFRSCGSSAAEKTVVNLPNVTSIKSYAFYYNNFIKELVAPKLYDIKSNAFTSSDIEKATIGNSSLAYIDFMSNSFSACNDLTSIEVLGNISRIQGYVFAGCTACTLYDFSHCTSVPNLQSSTAFNTINANAKIVVPDSLYSTWIAASNWSTYASYIIKKSDYDAL